MKNFYNTKEAAEYLTISNDLLRRSRMDGVLMGRDAPRYIRLGPRTIRYTIESLNEWITEAKESTKYK